MGSEPSSSPSSSKEGVGGWCGSGDVVSYLHHPQPPPLKKKGLLAALLLASACTPAPLAELHQTLAAQDSATAALGQWCGLRHLADDPTIHAALVRGKAAAPPAGLAETLALPANTAPGYRHVRLTCGGQVLSEAHNWYVRERLTPDMNRVLDQTDTPFGKAVTALHFTRQRLGETRGARFGCPSGTVLSHRARLVLPDGQPLALVVECYTPANLK